MHPLVATATLSLGLVLLYRCGPKEPEISGTWRNDASQLLFVGPNLEGQVTQEAPCSARLSIKVRRDPYDGYSIRFEPGQTVFFPPLQRTNFGMNEYFCASKDSVPMCAFCRVEGDSMKCNTPGQKIAGSGATVHHDCNWVRVSTSSTSTTTTEAERCEKIREGAQICSGSGGVDAGSPADGGATDGGADAGV